MTVLDRRYTLSGKVTTGAINPFEAPWSSLNVPKPNYVVMGTPSHLRSS